MPTIVCPSLSVRLSVCLSLSVWLSVSELLADDFASEEEWKEWEEEEEEEEWEEKDEIGSRPGRLGLE